MIPSSSQILLPVRDNDGRPFEGDVHGRTTRGDDVFRCPLGGLGGNVANDHPAALFAQASGRRRADPSGAADHDRNPVGQAAQPHADLLRPLLPLGM